MTFNTKYRFLTYVTFLLSGVNVAIFAQSAKEQSVFTEVILMPSREAKPAVTIAQDDAKMSSGTKWKSVLLAEFKYKPPADTMEATPPAPAEEDVVVMDKYVVVAQKDKKIEITEAKATGVRGFDNTKGGTLMRYEGKRMTTEILSINSQDNIRLFRLSW